MKRFFLLTAAPLILAAACAQTSSLEAESNTVIEAAEASINSAATSIQLDYEKFTLDNGLDVILHVDKSDPIVAVTTVVNVGSNREVPGRTGFAHFFEHMAFNDSENVPAGWNRKAIPSWGGFRNGATWSDGTIYFEVVPKDAFDKILWIDSDRLGYMINTVTQAALDREKEVVKNEKRQRVDNRAYGYTGEILRRSLYPEGHPYSWTVIGSIPDLQAATLEDVKEFHAKYYGPNNATLVIAGDINIDETKEKVERWFGEIPRGVDVEPLPAMPANLQASKSLYFEDNFARLPELNIVFPTVEARHPDGVALTVLANLIAGSKNSPLFTEIVETQKLAPNVRAMHSEMELAGEFRISVRANAGTDLDEVEAAIEAAFLQFEQNGVDLDDLQRIKAEQETAAYSEFATVLGKTNQMARSNTFSGDPLYANTYLARLAEITPDDVMAAYEKYIKSRPAVITSVVPKGQTDLAVDGAEKATVWIEEVKPESPFETAAGFEFENYEKTPTVHDRSEPPFGELPLFEMPDIWQSELSEGVKIFGIENSETPLVNVQITFEGGSMLDPLEKRGVTNLLSNLMNEGTASKTAAEMELAAGLLGSSISVRSAHEELIISITALSRNYEQTIALVEELLAAPRFEIDDFERVKSAALTSIEGREANPNAIASMAFSRVLYGNRHPMGLPVAGTKSSVSELTLDDMKSQFELIKGAPVNIHIAGDINAERAKAAFSPLASSLGARTTRPIQFGAPENANRGKVFFIDVPGSNQSVLYVGKLALSSTDEDASKLNFVNEKLGGGISSDLSQTLRIQKGFTYGAGSSVSPGREIRPFSARTSVRANATQPALETIRDMLDAYPESFTSENVETIKQKLIKQSSAYYEGLSDKVFLLRSMSKYGKSQSYLEEEQQQLIEMTVDDFSAISQSYLAESEMTYVVVGDKETQFDLVNEFADGSVIELDIFAEPIGE